MNSCNPHPKSAPTLQTSSSATLYIKRRAGRALNKVLTSSALSKLANLPNVFFKNRSITTIRPVIFPNTAPQWLCTHSQNTSLVFEFAARAMEPVWRSCTATLSLNWKFRKSVAREADWTRPMAWRQISRPSIEVVVRYSFLRAL